MACAASVVPGSLGEALETRNDRGIVVMLTGKALAMLVQVHDELGFGLGVAERHLGHESVGRRIVASVVERIVIVDGGSFVGESSVGNDLDRDGVEVSAPSPWS